jgi:hypothetical protein
MISAISSIVSSMTNGTAFVAVNTGKQVQSGAISALFPDSVASASSSEKGSAADSQTNASAGSTASTGERNADGSEKLTSEQEQQISELRQRDRAVRAHEQAHQSAGAGLTGPPSYTYTTGPDGKRYATGGEVSIDTSPERDNPRGTIQKMERVITAALAPADPSGQDRSVAAQANGIMVEAQMQLSQQKSSQTRALPGSNVNVVA